MTTFADLGLSPRLLKAMEGTDFVAPTPIQIKAIPPVLAGQDLMGLAQTGTGKTAAFGLPLLHRLLEIHHPAGARQVRHRSGSRNRPETVNTTHASANTSMNQPQAGPALRPLCRSLR